ncbi:MAG: hypothetical protein DRJ65_06055 [Acidobacteria bacterium]|nr:MAG: hypothetical protein DRJ65_06055 [Acidobacteriota bacterium]
MRGELSSGPRFKENNGIGSSLLGFGGFVLLWRLVSRLPSSAQATHGQHNYPQALKDLPTMGI